MSIRKRIRRPPKGNSKTNVRIKWKQINLKNKQSVKRQLRNVDAQNSQIIEGLKSEIELLKDHHSSIKQLGKPK